MTYKTCYWDEVEGVQKERDCTPEEVAEIELRKVSPEVVNAPVYAQIIALEMSVTPRRIREAIAGDNGWLAGVDSQIAALRSQLIK